MKIDKGSSTHFVADVSLKQTEGYLTTFNVADILRTLFSAYYKEFIYRSITDELVKGTKPEHIICFERSLVPDLFMKKELVLKYEDIPINPDTIQFFYLLGSPHALLPNKMIEDFHKLFRTYNRFFPSQRRFNMSKVDGAVLRNAFRVYTDFGVSDAFDSMLQELKQRRQPKSKQIRNTSWEEKDFKKWYEMVHTKDELTSQNKALLLDKIGQRELKQATLYDRYYMPGFLFLSSNLVPAVAILDQENMTMRFLGKELFDDVHNPYFFDFKSYSHNSPAVLEILGDMLSWIEVAHTLFKAGKYAYKLYKQYENSVSEPNFDDIISYSSDISVTQKEALRHYCSRLEENSPLKQNLKKIRNEYLKKEILGAYEEMRKGYTEHLQYFNLIISPEHKIEISIKKKK